MTATTDGRPDDEAAPALVPARMLNEHSYCPRLAYLEWVEGDFADSADTVDGRRVHRRVDQAHGELPEAAELAPEQPIHARSVYLSAPRVGLVAKIDLVEGECGVVTPVDYKRGKAPNLPEGAWEPERVQLCAQGMVLEENGYTCNGGVLYFAASKRRVEIAFDEALRRRTLELLAELRRSAALKAPPPPLVDSPKCPRCSLVSICLPDEVNHLARGNDEAHGPRRLLAPHEDALPLYVVGGGKRIGKRDDELVVEDRDGQEVSVRLSQTSHVAVFGAVQISTQALRAALEREVSVCYLSAGGWLYGMTVGMTHKNVELRVRQHQVAGDAGAALAVARCLVAGKVRNCRTLLRRNCGEAPGTALARLRELAEAAEAAEDVAILLGLEGMAARIYFEHFAALLHPAEGEEFAFSFEGRNRRPPTDRANALLSLAYALLAKETTLAALAVGLDPHLGFYHRPRYGRPALALDLMEEFRPLIADSVVLSAVNTHTVRARDFVVRGGAVALGEGGRKAFIGAFERRMEGLVTHPVFGYRLSYRRVLNVQARLLCRHLQGEVAAYPSFMTR